MRLPRSLLALLLGLVGCASAPDFDSQTNLLANGSFEQGREPWYDFKRPEKPYWGSFEISDARALHGQHSLLLRLDSADFPTSIGIAGAVQELALDALPRTLSGHYRVDSWIRHARVQYIQVVVMAFGASNFTELGASAQLAFVLAGIDEPYFKIDNRRYAFAGPLQPEFERWIPFEFDLHEAFERHWGKIPVDIEKVRFFAEARFDNFVHGGGRRARALVYFDALRLGE
jgi:hypothetical protein